MSLDLLILPVVLVVDDVVAATLESLAILFDEFQNFKKTGDFEETQSTGLTALAINRFCYFFT